MISFKWNCFEKGGGGEAWELNNHKEIRLDSLGEKCLALFRLAGKGLVFPYWRGKDIHQEVDWLGIDRTCNGQDF